MEFRPQIHRLDSVSSTNSEVARLALAGAREGSCVVADEQTDGRGRLQRKWISPRNSGLYFSILLQPQIDLKNWALLTLMSAVVVHDTLKETCGVNLDIKWPNDLIANERKICGILAETIESSYGRAVVLGIGVNLTRNAFPPEVAKTAISVEEATAKIPDRELVLQTLLAKLTEAYTNLHGQNGQARILDEWRKRSSYFSGKEIRVSLGDEVVQGVTRGLEDDGALRVETGDGQIKVIRAGDVTAVRSAE